MFDGVLCGTLVPYEFNALCHAKLVMKSYLLDSSDLRLLPCNIRMLKYHANLNYLNKHVNIILSKSNHI